jgi:hypothetical protein
MAIPVAATMISAPQRTFIAQLPVGYRAFG